MNICKTLNLTWLLCIPLEQVVKVKYLSVEAINPSRGCNHGIAKHNIQEQLTSDEGSWFTFQVMDMIVRNSLWLPKFQLYVVLQLSDTAKSHIS